MTQLPMPRITTAVFVPTPGDEALANALASAVGGRVAQVHVCTFADGEQHVRLEGVRAGDTPVIVTTLTYPAPRLLPTVFLAATAMELHAQQVGLVAPYLSCLRVDRRTARGTGGTSGSTATLLSAAFDWIVTVSPQLQGSRTMERQFSVPVHVVDCGEAISMWIHEHVSAPLIIVPHDGTAPWLRRLARTLRAPFLDVAEHVAGESPSPTSRRVAGEHAGEHIGRTPIIVNAVVESSNELGRLIDHLRTAGHPAPICVAAHPILAGDAYDEILAAGTRRLVSCCTIRHRSNAIDVTPWLANGVNTMLRASESATDGSFAGVGSGGF